MEKWPETLEEPSTWRGLTLLGTALGISLFPEHLQSLLVVGMSLTGLIGILIPDDPT